MSTLFHCKTCTERLCSAARGADNNELSQRWKFFLYSYCNELTQNGSALELLISFHCSAGLCFLLITNVSHLRIMPARSVTPVETLARRIQITNRCDSAVAEYHVKKKTCLNPCCRLLTSPPNYNLLGLRINY